MMKALLTYLLVTFMVSDHDVAIALFDVQFSEEGTTIEITVDQEDLAQSLVTRDISVDVINSYLSEKSTWFFNATESQLVITSMTPRNDHYILKGRFLGTLNDVQSVDITNHFLLDIVNHSNIIKFHTSKGERDFRMHQGRTEISVSL